MSGYCCVEEAYSDKITVTGESIAYYNDMNNEQKAEFVNRQLFQKEYHWNWRILMSFMRRERLS